MLTHSHTSPPPTRQSVTSWKTLGAPAPAATRARPDGAFHASNPIHKHKTETDQNAKPRSLPPLVSSFKVAAPHNAKGEAKPPRNLKKAEGKSHSSLPQLKNSPSATALNPRLLGAAPRPGPHPLSRFWSAAPRRRRRSSLDPAEGRSARAWVSFASFLWVSNLEARLDGLPYPKSCPGSRINLYPLRSLAVDSCAAQWFGWRVRLSSYLEQLQQFDFPLSPFHLFSI
jgi:hypothetical protein